jgi:hypothetical protein
MTMDVRLDTSQAKISAGGSCCAQNPSRAPGSVAGGVTRPPPGRFYRAFRAAASAVLLGSATLKSLQYARVPAAPHGLWGAPAAEPALVAFEIFLGLWLISGAFPAAARRVAIGCFSVFACYTLYEALSGGGPTQHGTPLEKKSKDFCPKNPSGAHIYYGNPLFAARLLGTVAEGGRTWLPRAAGAVQR